MVSIKLKSGMFPSFFLIWVAMYQGMKMAGPLMAMEKISCQSLGCLMLALQRIPKLNCGNILIK